MSNVVISHSIAVQELVLVVGLLLSADPQVPSNNQIRPRAELCEMYATGMRGEFLLSEEREDDPCLEMDSPLDYIVGE